MMSRFALHFYNDYQLINDNKNPLFNRALSGLYPPGSIFKLLNGLIALEENVINENKFYSCTKGFEYEKDKFVKCHPHKSLTNLEQAIAISCNTYFCQAFSDTFKKFNTTKEAYDLWRNHINEIHYISFLQIKIL